MKLTIEHDPVENEPYVQVTEIYSNFVIKTDAGQFAICQRDSGIELHLDDGPWYTWQDKNGPVKLGPPDHAKVPIENLQYMATMRCQHGEHDSCAPLGALCNSCWARSFAEDMLRLAGVPLESAPPSKQPKVMAEVEKDVDIDPDTPLGSLDRFRHG